MRTIIPTAITDAMLTSTNLTEDDYAEWLIGTTYAADDYVIVIGTSHRIFQSLQDSNTGNDPSEAANVDVYWRDVSATNRWKPFDGLSSKQAVGTDSITYTLDNLGMVDGIAFFGLVAETVRVEIVNDSVTVYDQTISLSNSGDVIDAYTYFFEPFSFISKLIAPEIPPYTAATYNITIAGSGTVKVGQISLGRDRYIGKTLFGTGLGINDFSRTERDDFGDVSFKRGNSFRTVDFEVSLDTSAAERAFDMLDGIRSQGAVFYAGDSTDKYGTTVFAFFTGLKLTLSGPQESDFSLQVEELK